MDNMDMEKDKKRRLISSSVSVLVVSVAVAAILFTVGRKRDKYYLVTEGLEVPAFSLPTLDGETITLTEQRGKVLLINLWATWCPACIEEMPSMERLYQDLKKRDVPFDMLAINIDSSNVAELKQFARKMNITFPILYDRSKNVPYLFKSIGIPETYIVDKKGVIRKKIIGGYDWDREDTRQLIEELLKEEG